MLKRLLLGAAIFLGGCGTLGVDSPKGFLDQVATAQSTNTALVRSFGLMASLGKVSKSAGTNALKQVTAAQQGIDAAVTLSDVNLSDANSRLQIVNTALNALVLYLQSQQAQPTAKDAETALLVAGLLQISTDQALKLQTVLSAAHAQNRAVNKDELAAMKADFTAAFNLTSQQINSLP